MAAAAADWSQAPADILWNIIKRLPMADHIRFGGVCVPWRSVLAQKRCGPATQVPWLMLPGDGNGPNDGTVRFFSLAEKKDYLMSLPEIRDFRCIGSSEGILIYTDEYSELHMLDPISGAHVDLPSITTLPDVLGVSRDSQGRIERYIVPDGYPGGTHSFTVNFRFSYFQKAILSPGSTLESYMVVAISSQTSGNIPFARAGDTAWSVIHIPDGFFEDVVFHDQLLFALEHPTAALTINLNHPSAPIISVEGKEGFGTLEDNEEAFIMRYLVVVLSSSGSGELLLVSRYVDSLVPTNLSIYQTVKVSLHKLDSSRRKWVVAKSIGDHALFLGHGHSVSFCTLDFPEIKPNCIYFTDNVVECYSQSVPFDMGVYDIEDGSMKPYYPPDSILNWPPPIWFTPNMKNMTDDET